MKLTNRDYEVIGLLVNAMLEQDERRVLSIRHRMLRDGWTPKTIHDGLKARQEIVQAQLAPLDFQI